MGNRIITGTDRDFLDRMARAYGDDAAATIRARMTRRAALEDAARIIDAAGADYRAAFDAFDRETGTGLA